MGWNSYFDAPLLTALLNAQGIPPIDQAAETYADTINLPLGTDFLTPVIDMARYNSISIVVDEVNGAVGSCPIVRLVYVDYFADAAGLIFMNSDVYGYFPSNGALLVTPSMIKGPYVQIHIVAIGAGAAVAVVDISVVGSMRNTGTQSRVECFNRQATPNMVNTGDEGVFTAGSAAWPIGASDMYPCVYGGPATFGWEVGPVAAVGYVRVYDARTVQTIWAITFPVSANSQRGSIPIELPVHPIWIRFFNANPGVLAGYFGLTMDGCR